MNPDRLTQPANDAMVRFVEAMTEPEAPEQTIEKLVGVYRVFIPHFISAYTFHKNNTSQITDAPTIRSLNFILQDEFDDWRDGEMMMQSLHRDARRGRPGGGAPGASSRRSWSRPAASPARVRSALHPGTVARTAAQRVEEAAS